MLPDADVLAFKFGIAYGNVLAIADLPTLLLSHSSSCCAYSRDDDGFEREQVRCWLFLTVSFVVAQPAGFDHHGW